MSDEYRAKLIDWAVHALLLVVVAVVTSLVNRWIGVPVDVPPPPPITVTVTSPPGSTEHPKVTVFQPSK